MTLEAVAEVVAVAVVEVHVAGAMGVDLVQSHLACQTSGPAALVACRCHCVGVWVMAVVRAAVVEVVAVAEVVEAVVVTACQPVPLEASTRCTRWMSCGRLRSKLLVCGPFPRTCAANRMSSDGGMTPWTWSCVMRYGWWVVCSMGVGELTMIMRIAQLKHLHDADADAQEKVRACVCACALDVGVTGG